MTLRLGLSLCLALLPHLAAQNDWPAYGHDPGGMRYSPLHADYSGERRDAAPGLDLSHRRLRPAIRNARPIVVGGRMYLSTQTRPRCRAANRRPARSSGASTRRSRAPRTSRRRLLARRREATAAHYLRYRRRPPDRARRRHRQACPGIRRQRRGQPPGRRGRRFPRASYGITSPPAIYRDLVIVGPSTQEGPSRGPSGDPARLRRAHRQARLAISYRARSPASPATTPGVPMAGRIAPGPVCGG